MLGAVGTAGGREDPGQVTGLALQEGLQIQILQELKGVLPQFPPDAQQGCQQGVAVDPHQPKVMG